MRLYYSDIFHNFRCTGTNCKDNCCTVGWDIEIDDKTLSFYKSLDSELGRKLVENIYEEDGCHYMGQDGGCPFMNENGLCSVQLEYGEEHISDICREHPRFYEWFGGYKEAGVGLCCEAVCDMLVNHPAPILFTEKDIDEEDDELEYDSEMLRSVLRIRLRLIDIMQNRSFDISERLKILLYSAQDIQEAVDSEDHSLLKKISGMLSIEEFLEEVASTAYNDTCDKSQCAENILSLFTKLDYIHPYLKEKFEYAHLNIGEILSRENEFVSAYGENCFELEHIAVYFLFRYLIKAVRDYDAVTRIYQAILFTYVIKLLFTAEFVKQGRLPSKEERAIIIKEFSKEIEYSVENTDMIYEEMLSGEIGFESLNALLQEDK